MINGLHETHIQVHDLERSLEFYTSLGLEVGSYNKGHSAFLIIGERGRHQTLGLWQVADDKEIDRRHFAFDVQLDDLRAAKEWLLEKGIETKGVFGRDNSEPIVHAWTPAAAIYFDDPDGNELEFYSYLPGSPRKASRTPTLSEWENGLV